MIIIQKAQPEHAAGIAKVCTVANWNTYKDIRSKAYIIKVVEEFYKEERIVKEIQQTDKAWGGWFVAIDEEFVVGAAGGGMTAEKEAELYVLYLDPNRRNEGIGTQLLQSITELQRKWGAIRQWVSVAKGNQKGIPFYEARGFQFQSEQPDDGSLADESYRSLRYMRLIEPIR
ncbi:GNAT family N-acetyltransferase [Virgibacillus senegalensis]|uniref:GNAT family N-acetyltransferase n=1 Tax=Virgibacillus senegalensis TaxID=1499679 RepID=UPI00069F7FBB|nr:GNAT family N-acetyltransferase [Virgibacillus senegalensis]